MVLFLSLNGIAIPRQIFFLGDDTNISSLPCPFHTAGHRTVHKVLAQFTTCTSQWFGRHLHRIIAPPIRFNGTGLFVNGLDITPGHCPRMERQCSLFNCIVSCVVWPFSVCKCRRHNERHRSAEMTLSPLHLISPYFTKRSSPRPYGHCSSDHISCSVFK